MQANPPQRAICRLDAESRRHSGTPWRVLCYKVGTTSILIDTWQIFLCWSQVVDELAFQTWIPLELWGRKFTNVHCTKVIQIDPWLDYDGCWASNRKLVLFIALHSFRKCHCPHSFFNHLNNFVHRLQSEEELLKYFYSESCFINELLLNVNYHWTDSQSWGHAFLICCGCLLCHIHYAKFLNIKLKH